ncbi:MAG TPA: hypothetical protein VMN39_12755 [Longimicrobiaceae bacterium]|nr:hypothetical protein [Longimicrobiaceae bacterium]
MKTLQWILAGVAFGVVAVAFRDLERREWLRPALPGGVAVDDEEPVLGYDGMDQETAIDWIASADLDEDTVERIIRFERENLDRLPVIEALEELLG